MREPTARRSGRVTTVVIGKYWPVTQPSPASSARPRKSVYPTWLWALTKPGMTTLRRPSRTRAAAGCRRTTSSLGPTSTMRAPST